MRTMLFVVSSFTFFGAVVAGEGVIPAKEAASGVEAVAGLLAVLVIAAIVLLPLILFLPVYIKYRRLKKRNAFLEATKAEAEANLLVSQTVLSEAKATAGKIIQSGNDEKLKIIQSGEDEKLEIIKKAREEAQAIAGEALEAKGKADEYERAAKASQNIIKGNDGECVIPRELDGQGAGGLSRRVRNMENIEGDSAAGHDVPISSSRRPPPDAVTVCFTGFSNDEELDLKRRAGNAGLWAVGSVSGRLGALVAGPDAGPKKLRLAKEKGVKIITRDAFVDAVDKGLPLASAVDATPTPEAVGLRDTLQFPPGVFVAVDFETADCKHDSACAIGVVRVENGVVVAEEHRLIRPPREKVMPRNTRIHGLDWQCLRDQPDFAQVWHSLRGIFDGADHLVAHNAAFDRSVMEASCDAYSLEPATAPFLCTLRGTKATITLDSYKLPDICTYFLIPFGQHHHALSDAKAALRLCERLCDAGVPLDAMRIPSASKKTIPAAAPAKRVNEQDAIREFSALAQALVCDQVLNHKEFEYLHDWLVRHFDLLAESPGMNPVFDLVAGAMSDGIVTDAELEEIRRVLAARSGS